WDIVSNVVETLIPIEEVTLEVSHNNSSASCIIPCLTVLKMLFQASHTVEPLAESCLEDELHMYLKEPVIDRRKGDPLQWRQNEGRFKLLATQARKFLCPPPSSVPSERVFSEVSAIYEKNRSRLTGKHADPNIAPPSPSGVNLPEHSPLHTKRYACGARPAAHPSRLKRRLLSSSSPPVLRGEMLPLVYVTLSVPRLTNTLVSRWRDDLRVNRWSGRSVTTPAPLQRLKEL
ncbi:hypothetical protein KUCAC02_012991, partial [Chaenocephalus aceratus]